MTIYISITTALIISAVFLTLKYYSNIKLITSDLLSSFGFLGKWIRKQRVSSEVEGTLNGVIDDFNRNFSTPLLPNCKIQWVTPDNQQNVLKENQAIVCLSFDKRDHDLNFYNATFNFIQTALVSKAKPFIRKTTSKALDLLSTKIILRQYRRQVLRTFNNKFAEVEPDVKDLFHRLGETDQNGLFSTLLLPEFYHLGENLNDKTPSQSIEAEIEQFLNWFYDLATRDIDEKSKLRYESQNIKVGVILVAKLETYNQYGTEAYVRRAVKYASEGFGAIYLLSKGTRGNKIAKEVADVLVETKGFEKINKNEISKRMGDDGKQILITCISLRPDPATIRFNAWEFVKQKFSKSEKVIGIIETITPDFVITNVNGLQFVIPKKELSAATITDATKIFNENQELQLNILECKPENEHLVLSNNGTETDPKIFIDANLSNENPVSATITRIQKDKEGTTKGLMVKVSNPSITVFIPTSKATHSRFTDISIKYPEGAKIEIILEQFQFDFGNYIGRIYNLPNPYECQTFTNLTLGSEVSFKVKDIQERFIVGEIEEGLECKLPVNEISWTVSECTTNKFNIDDTVNAKIVFLDKEFYRISVSLKQFVPSPTKDFFDTYKDKIIQGVISKIDDTKGIYFTPDNLEEVGFIHWSELSWAHISPISAFYSIGQTISAKVIQYKEGYDSIVFSCKRCIPHQYDEIKSSLNDNEFVTGEIVNHFNDIVIVKITHKSFTAQGYLHKSQVSNCVFINSNDMPIYFPISSTFNFFIERFDDKNSVIEVSRKGYLNGQLDNIELGVSYTVYFTKSYSGKYYFYSQELEGYIFNGKRVFEAGKTIEVIPVSTTSDEYTLA